MRKRIVMLLGVGVAMLLAPVPAYAEGDEFYVEVGDDVKKEDAAGEWEKLVDKHKSLLGKLKMFPKEIIHADASVNTRMQAGPISGKAKAQKICKKLFDADVPCFVIEGLAETPPSVLMSMSGNAGMTQDNLPWISSRAQVAAAPEVHESESILPWLRDEKAKEEANKKKQAEVQVAEAIRVPLTNAIVEEGGSSVSVKQLPELKPSFKLAQAGGGAYPDESKDSGAGWLTVGAFLNDEIATSFWEEVRTANAKQAKSLSVRITRPVMDRNQPRTSISVGPFASSADAYDFCRKGIQAQDRGLTCGFVANDSGMANKQLLTLNSHSAAYAERRAPRELRRRPLENPPSYVMPAAGPSKQYWIQVVTAASQMDALHQWEGVKSANADVLGRLRSNVSASPTDKSTFVVRVGPVANNEDAISLCGKLQKRNVDCRVLLYSMGVN